MALIAVSGDPGCPYEDAARIAARRLRFEFAGESRIRTLIDEQLGPGASVPDKAYADLLTSILATLAVEHHLVVCASGAEFLVRSLPGMLRVHITASEARRVGGLMIDRGLERPAARRLLRQMEKDLRAERARRFGRATAPAHLFDMVLNAETIEAPAIAELVEFSASVRGLQNHGLLPAEAEAHLQFQLRLRLSRHGLRPAARVELKRKAFSHPSEETFANLLDFYGIAWQYEPRSFPVRWSEDGRPLQAFTPDFYLPDFDLYVELTTMKQSLVTKKNRKVKLLRSLYPHLNIQVFYQKDLQDLIFKYGLAERAVAS